MLPQSLVRILALLVFAAMPILASDAPAGDEKEDAELVIGARDPKVFNEIDRFILIRLRAENIEPSPICTDFEFVRRAFVDVAGVIPTGQEIKAFLNDKSADKRARLVEKLL